MNTSPTKTFVLYNPPYISPESLKLRPETRSCHRAQFILYATVIDAIWQFVFFFFNFVLASQIQEAV